jgi:hypothetical protein
MRERERDSRQFETFRHSTSCLLECVSLKRMLFVRLLFVFVFFFLREKMRVAASLVRKESHHAGLHGIFLEWTRDCAKTYKNGQFCWRGLRTTRWCAQRLIKGKE